MSPVTGAGVGAGRTTVRRAGIGAVVSVEVRRLFLGYLLWFAIVAPLVLGAAHLVWVVLLPQEFPLIRNSFLHLWVLYLPLHGAVIAAVSVSQDDGAMRYLLGYPLPRGWFFVGKLVGVLALMAVSQVVLFAGLAAINVVAGDDGWAHVLSWPPASLAAAAGAVALAQVVAHRFGLGACIGFGAVGMVLGALVRDAGSWAYLPFAWPVRTVLTLQAGTVEGTSAASAEFADPVAVPLALGLSAALALGSVLAGSLVMSRKQV